MQRKPTSRRGYGSGSLTTKSDASGAESWYGLWYSGGRRVKRKLGRKRAPGSHDGLTRPQAEARLRELMGQTTVSARGERLNIAEVARRYVLAAERKRRKPSTIENVESEVRVHLAPFFGDRSLDRITSEDVADLIANLEAQGLAPKTIHNIVGTCSALFNFAKAPRRRWATTNPCVGAELPAIPEATEIRFLTLDEVDLLIAHARGGVFQTLDRALYLTAAMSGLRLGELVALRWRDIDWTAARIRVRQNYVRGKYGSPKSRRSTRSVPMADEIGGELDRLFKASAYTAEDDLVFAHPVHGKPLTKANVTRRVHKALADAGLDETHVFHDLRHTFGTRMAAAGVPLRTLQEWMGHRHISTTERYADYAPSGREGEMIAAAFARPEPQGSIQGSILSEPEGTERT
jgi:integrase